MVASTLLVQADLSGTAFGGAFVPTDITRFVRLVDGININEWRQDSQSAIAPSTMNLTLDNEALAGDATAPNAGRFTPGLSTSPWTGKILPGVRFRISETVGGTTYQLYDGYAFEWSAKPGSDDGSFPVVAVSCTDALGWMGVRQPLRSIYIEEVLLDTPSAFYPLDEPAGSTAGGDLTGISAPAVPITSEFGAGTLAFGDTPTMIDAAGAVSMSSTSSGSSTTVARGTWLSVPNRLPAALPAANGLTVEVWFKGPATPPAAVEYLLWCPGSGNQAGAGQTGEIALYLDTTGNVEWRLSGSNNNFSGISAHTFCDGLWHHIALTMNAASTTATLYIDGAVESTQTLLAMNWTNQGLPILIGMLATASQVSFPLAGSVALSSQYLRALTSTRVTAHYNAGRNALAGERHDQRISRLLSYRPNLGSILDVAKGVIGVQSTAGVALAQALLDVAKSEGGLLFADGQGRVIFFNRARFYDPATSATFDIEADLTAEFEARIDTQQLINDMTVNRPGGAAQRATNAASVTTYGPRAQSDSYVVNSDRDAADAAGWLVANQKTPAVRTPELTADITTMTSVAQAQAVLARGPLDRVGLSNLPSWAPPTDVLVQGRSIRITDRDFVVGFFTSPTARNTLRADAAASANTKLDAGLVIPW